MTWMIRNSRGRPDALLTFSVWGVVVVLLKVLGNGASFKGVSFGAIDAALVGAVLAPTLGSYVVKRVKGGKADEGEKS
jgi:hypothetical protein